MRLEQDLRALVGQKAAAGALDIADRPKRGRLDSEGCAWATTSASESGVAAR